jgi:CxxC motif-containing protein (DUF1111 family)
MRAPALNATELPTAGGMGRSGLGIVHRVGRFDGSKVPLYSDLLLHDLGPALDDRVIQGSARGKDWRTTPLWGLGMRPRLLHDGRATSINEAVLAHDGEAANAARAFRALVEPERTTLLAFLNSL